MPAAFKGVESPQKKYKMILGMFRYLYTFVAALGAFDLVTGAAAKICYLPIGSAYTGVKQAKSLGNTNPEN